MTLHLRLLTDAERAQIERITHAQTAPVRLVRRARIIQLAITGLTVPVIAHQLELSELCVRRWIQRFNQEGLAGLADAPRAGRPRTYDEAAYSQVIAKARGLPPQLPGAADAQEPPTGHWTLDRLQAELAKDGLAIKRSQIRRLLRAEHIKWQQPRTWLESDDPEFAAKRGRSSSSIRTRPPTAPSSVSMS